MKMTDEQLLMQSQDIVSALSNQVPVLSNRPVAYTARVAINFLRSGCPGVQIVFDRTVDLIEQMVGWSWQYEVRELKQWFRALRLKGERFTFSCREEPQLVLLVTRSSSKKKPDSE